MFCTSQVCEAVVLVVCILVARGLVVCGGYVQLISPGGDVSAEKHLVRVRRDCVLVDVGLTVSWLARSLGWARRPLLREQLSIWGQSIECRPLAANARLRRRRGESKRTARKGPAPVMDDCLDRPLRVATRAMFYGAGGSRVFFPRLLSFLRKSLPVRVVYCLYSISFRS